MKKQNDAVKYTLLKTQRNEIFKILSSLKLNASLSMFKWEEIKSANLEGPVSKLIFKQDDREFYYIFDFDDIGDCDTQYFPGESVNIVEETGLEWSDQIKYFKEWASRVKNEIESPDLWNEIAKIQSSFQFNYTPSENTDPISAAQAIKLREGLSKLKYLLEKEFKLNKDQIRFVRYKIEYLSSKIETQNISDWIHTAIGVFVSIALAIGVSAANSDKFWQLIKQTIGMGFSLLLGQ